MQNFFNEKNLSVPLFSKWLC